MKTRRKAFLFVAMLLTSGMASAQVLVKGNVYGGGDLGVVTGNTEVTVNDGTIGRKLTLEQRKCDANAQSTRIDFGNVYGGGNGFEILGYDQETGAPIFSETAGGVQGNTTVTIDGNAVVRHAVYGGGNIGSVGVFTPNGENGATYTAGGTARVTIQGSAIIGPTLDDLTKDDAGQALSSAAIDSAFKYVGCNEGVVYGSSRGLAGRELRHLSFANSTVVTVTGSANVVGNVLGGGENGHVQTETNVTINGSSVIGGFPLHGENLLQDDEYTIPEGIYDGTTVHLKGADAELYEDEFGVGRRVFRGNVFGGGRGTDYVTYLSGNVLGFYSGRVYGNTNLTVGGSAKIYNRVYGGGTVASVGTYTYSDATDPSHHTITGLVGDSGHAYVTINGGTIGTNGKNNGEVFGGGRGIAGSPNAQAVDEGYVGYTHVEVDGGNIKHSVYGGSANGHVLKDCEVLVKQSEGRTTVIGDTTWVRDGENYIVQVHGGWHSNVYGGGGGTTRYKKTNGQLHHSITAGRVFGDTYVTIEGGRIWHNVYGGGALASVGTYLKKDSNNNLIPYESGGYATVTITGGEIGYDGNENGMVFGSGRGEIAAPGNFLDSVTYVAYSFVNIGKETTPGSGTYTGNAKINGSVYGGGENGHVYLNSTVNVFKGTIGCSASEYTSVSEENFKYRGNVYGAGCGTDMYASVSNGTPDTYNPTVGLVQGNTNVNIYGGYISRNVYGGGAMASVGSIDHTATVSHLLIENNGINSSNFNTAAKMALSWPYELTYVELEDPNTHDTFDGKATINISGGHIGTVGAPVTASGNVYGSARGVVGPLYMYDTLAIARETEINIDFTPPTGTINDDTPNVILGSIYGSGENGQTYENTKITLTNGRIVGSVFGGGQGTDTYSAQLKDPGDDQLYWTDVRSITAGKVYGNTEVNINGGIVEHNVFGGGDLASVGKGNYIGYGEITTQASGGPDYDEDTYGGLCKVTINGGTIGTDGLPDYSGNVNGFVFGSSKGITFVNVSNTPRYDYSRDFFLGYANMTNVTIGSSTGSGTGPTIHGSVFGGGEDGHVRWNTEVTVNKGTIGEEFVASNPETDSINKWVYRGNVYGAGRGIDYIDPSAASPEFCSSAGSVTLNTTVTVKGGTIHRNVYGGGSNASAGPPSIPGATYSPGTSLCTVNIEGGTIGQKDTDGLLVYGGHVFGAGRGHRDLLNTNNIGRFATSNETQVNIETGADVYGNVYGGGEIGQVKKDALVNMKNGIVEGSVFGGGKGEEIDEKAALVLGNATVDMKNGTVERSIYGGGQLGSVGTYTEYTPVTYPSTHPHNPGGVVNVPKTCDPATGLTTVKVSGGSVGYNGSLMPWVDHNPNDDDRGWIFCGGQGLTDSINYYKAIALGVARSTYLEISNTSDDVRPLITASVYGGAENGLVLGDTHVKIAGGQIGSGLVSKTTTNPIVGTFDPIYDEDKWTAAIDAINNGTIETVLATAPANGGLQNYFHECDAWTFETPYNVYDIEANNYTSNGGALTGSDGHSFFGNVFGGGSGYYPIAPGVWRRSAGRVCGDTHVEITGGHILTSVYGGNEITDVMGKCTVTMSGGTLGVPRDSISIAHHPTICYLFGGGMGDPRTRLNTWSNVNEVEVNVKGGYIFGSIFGGGEDGHVLGDAKVNIGCEEGKSPLIGTLGYSYVDGNVFGGGRGFQGVALTAGGVGGNVEVNIMGGTMLGSIYGGGRLASVGTYLVADNNTNYGKMMADNGTTTHGHITVNIGGTNQKSDITIGNDHESKYSYRAHNYGGNVYGGGMGRLEMLNGSTNDKWHQMGRVKNTIVNISEKSGKSTIIKGAVYGGGEMGTVGGELGTTDDESTHVTINGGTLWFNVFGGGHGSDNLTKLAVLDNTTTPQTTVTPAQMAGRVMGHTNVTVEGGWIKKSIYGGGELASVGRITDSIKHTESGTLAHPFYLSWPYEFTYAIYPNTTDTTGKANITIHGGRIGMTGKDFFGPWSTTGVPMVKPSGSTTYVVYNPETTGHTAALKAACKDNGDIYGGCMGKVNSPYVMAHMGNVRRSIINVNYTNTDAQPSNYNPAVDNSNIEYNTGFYPNWATWTGHATNTDKVCITGAVYGGGEDGQIYDNTNITLTKGLVGHAIYGGGKGKGKYNGEYVATCGKVFGNTNVTVAGGYVVRSVFGGGNLASVGKGNYLGYDETTTNATLIALANATGKAKVKISGGTLGMLNPDDPNKVFKENIPYGSVFGGCRGIVIQASELAGHHFGFVNNTEVTIGGDTPTNVTPGATNSPRIYGSVYGGAQDGHVRSNTKVIVNGGEIGVEYGATPQIASGTMGVPTMSSLTTPNLVAGNIGLDDPNWTDRGNVFGGGSGKGLYNENVPGTYNKLAGSVLGTTEVEIKGGFVHRAVYGGGSLATVKGDGTATDHDKVKVTVSDYAKVGLQSDILGKYVVENGNSAGTADTTICFSYGGDVYGAGMGMASGEMETVTIGEQPVNKYKFRDYCNVQNTDVTVSGGNVYGDVYGGGENGHVLYHTDVKINTGAKIGLDLEDNVNGGTWGGTTSNDGNVFGGGEGSGYKANEDTDFAIYKHCGRVGGNTNVTMTGGTIQGTIFGGGRLALTGVNEDGDPYHTTGQQADSINHGLASIVVSGTTTGRGNNITYSTSIGNSNGNKLLNGSAESVGDIFGSGKGDVKHYEDILAGRVANAKIRINGSPRIYGSVFGGGEMAGIGYYYENANKQVFYNYTGTSDIVIGSSSSDNPVIGTDYEFDPAYYATAHDWTVFDTDGSLIHTCTGNVFGGAQGDVDPESPHWVSMAKSKQTKVVVNGGTIKSRVFGGAEQGSVAGNTRVEINGGTIGTYVTSTVNNLPPYYYGGVLGGGYGSHREDYNVLTHENDSTDALGGTLWRPDYLAGRVYGNARVDVLGGTIKGNVFGGAAYAYLGGYGSSPKGDVLVNIGKEDVEGQPIVGSATFYGSVFGANNRSGTPYGNVNVNVYHTAHRTWTEGTVSYTDFAPTLPTGLEWTPDLLNENINGTGHFNKRQGYAIKQVFGGGNRADFTPNSANRTVVPRSTTVHVYYCENTIEDLYGGGNAADIGTEGTNGSANSNVEVDGGRFYRVFGGGNGLVEPANIYGTASTEINAGVIQEVYGGGNSNGFIDEIILEITNNNAYHPINNPTGCDAFIYDVFGGNNEAEIIGDIVSVINCGDGYQHEFYGANNNATIYGNVTTNVFGGTTDFLFGGSKGSSQEAHIRQFPSYAEITADQALPANQRKYSQSLLEYMNYDPTNSNIFKTELVHTKGNVTLNIFGGAITQAAFGGSDVNGTIDGKITVNVFDAETTCALDLNNLYGAGRNTDYDPIYDLPPGTTERISPEINVIHGTVKGSVYGGGQGTNATVEANPVVNIGYYPDLGEYDPEGNHEGDVMDALYDTIIKHTPGWTGTTWGIPHYAASVNLEVYGGGELAAVSGNTRVNMFRGTVGTDGIGSAVNGTKGYNGNIYGGGKGSYSSLTSLTDGHVEGNTVVEMQGGTVKGNIYGGGRLALTGIDENGVMQDDIEDDPTTPLVNEAKTYGHTKVMIKGGTVGNNNTDPNNPGNTIIETFTEFSMGNVYGGGKGYLNTNSPSSNNAEKSLLLGLTKNTEVEISQPTSTATHVYGIVLGGGEIASVGKYTLTKTGNTITNIAVTEGLAKVKISGGTIGDDYSQMRSTTASGSPRLTYNDDLGYVYGGGEGWSDKPTLYPSVQESATSSMSLLDLVATVQSTEVEISGSAWVKASVFGGSESGHVRGDTKVTIKGGQIGAGDNSGSSEDVWYTDAHFADPTSTTWYPTAHWDYASPYTPFDPAYLSQGREPKDGRSWFGNVFGGGSGWFPYVVNEGTEENPIWKSYWNANSGKVWGNTEVIIEGGHILNNVYGANESTDVGDFGIADATYTGEHPLVHVGDLYCKTENTGKATVKISGGTIGIPLTESQIQARPLFGNVFGGGAGDPRRIFNEHTNVDNTDIQITGGHIYGSVFGGAEQGHVVGGTLVSISQVDNDKPTVIGTTGFSGYDGHVFGGGKGDETDYDKYPGDLTANPPLKPYPNLDCGRVGGNTSVTMSSGTVLGNLYGGGMIALTGVGKKGLENYTDNGFWSFINEVEGNNVYDSIHHGFAQIELTGGTIGNPANDEGLTLLLKAQESGNVYGGGRGNDKEYEEDDLGRAAKAVVKISGSPIIYGSVFGGGQRANVGHWNSYDTWYTIGTGQTEVTVNGTPTIGTEKEFTYAYATGTGDSAPVNTVYETVNNAKMLSHTRTGNVFGGGEGLLGLKLKNNNQYAVGLEQGHCRTTRVKIGTDEGSNPTIKSCVFGGSEVGAVWGDTKVTIARGTIGKKELESDIVNPSTGNSTGNKGQYSFGSVFGGSYGADSYLKYPTSTFPPVTEQARDSINRLAGRVYGNTEVTITGGIVRGNVFGGGDMASVGDTILDWPVPNPFIDLKPKPNTGHAKVNVSGTAIIGPMDGNGLNAYVYGGGKGIGNDPTNLRNKYCNINSTEVTVNLTYEDADPEADNPEALWDEDTDGRIYGSIYGGGSDCHVLGDTKVVLNGGLIGTYKDATEGITAYGGNIFGSGRNFLIVNYAAGRVAGNTEIEMNNGVVYGAIFGGGRNAVTGTGLDGMTMRYDVEDDPTTTEVDETEIHGHTTVKVKGGTVGYKPLVTSYLVRPIGEVFGGGKGNMNGIALPGHPAASPLLVALVKNTVVEISQAEDGVPTYVLNSVYGGGEVGNLGHYTWTQSGNQITAIDLMEGTGTANVTIKGGRIGVERMVMSYELVGGTGPDKFNPKTNPVGNVFGGCKGISVDPESYASGISTARFGNKYLVDLMATSGSTTVVVENDGSKKPWVKSSVYGGSACGHVVGNTEVTIAGGQIGASDDGSTDHAQYNDGDFVNAFNVDLDDPDNSEHLMNPTYHWEYDPNTLRPFDVVEIYNGIDGSGNYTYVPTDGKTWYGNVFGGGSGFLSYVTGSGTNVDPYVSHWNRESGKVYGNSTVTITGGHILSNVYGGCEVSDVGMYEYNTTIHGDVHNTNSSLGTLANNGTATVDIQGGTVGVPRTTDQFRNHPIPGYVYGSGKGDPRIYFNTWTNVNETSVTVTGGKIFGCLFGGGEDGHVMGDVTMSVSETDGNTNPTVIGCTGLSGAEGNVFGGGRGTTNEALTAGTVGGNVDLTVSGGKVLSSVFGGGNRGSVGTYLVDKEYNNGSGMVTNPYYGKMREDGGGKTYGYTTVTVSGSTIVGNSKVTPTHSDPITTGGNVFGGGRGIYKAYSGSGDMPIWPSQARVKQTVVNIEGTAAVKNSVYGGGQVGTVRDDATVYVKENCIIGGNYGTNQYCGHVFGGGQGYESLDDQNDSTEFVGHSMPAIYLAGRVYGNTNVYIQGGHVYENVFGGGHVSSVGWVKDDGTLVDGVATVKMTGGIIGELDYSAVNAYIFGGPKGGANNQMKLYYNVNSTDVEVDYTDSDANRLWGSIFGGGSDGHVLGEAKVTLKSGTVGTDGITGYDGNIFGGGRNYHELGLTAGRVGGNIEVSMTGGTLQGNIYGGGRQGLTGVDENGDVYTTNTADHGNITVNVSSGTVGTGAASETSGHVYGGGKGQANSSQTGYDHNRLGEVRSTDVTIQGNATVNGSVFGGSENGWVLENSSATIAGTATIGHDANNYQGNVFGGGCGVKPTPGTTYIPEAGRVKGIARANVSGGTIKRHVFGGGNSGIVEGARIVNIDEADPTKPTTINGSVFGGSNEIPDEDGTTTPPTLYSGHGNLKTVNVRGGHIKGSVYGSGFNADEGNLWSTWNSFVNITGGDIDGDVFGAGYGGTVDGSVCVNVGLTAVMSSPPKPYNIYYNDGLGGEDPEIAKLTIGGNIYGGSYIYQSGGGGTITWDHNYDITGRSNIYIDGSDYNTTTFENKYMNIAGGIYGSGSFCESGKKGREVVLRNYGTRNNDANYQLQTATRTLTTMQRVGTVLLDNSNVNFTGVADISGQYLDRDFFAVLQIDKGLYVTNGSGIVLGTASKPAYMDSIRLVKSLYLDGLVSYDHMDIENDANWQVVGIKDNDNKLYSIDLTNPSLPSLSELAMVKENVIIFNNDSRLWVRYDDNGTKKYGELQGFFRMRAERFTPIGMESFAYARPKLTVKNNNITTPVVEENKDDGGFLSYNTEHNFFTQENMVVLNYTYRFDGDDGGDAYTSTKQYPYFNVSLAKRGDREEYREWVLPQLEGQIWYVDGTRGIGQDLSHEYDWGDYPDKPKKSLTGNVEGGYGIYHDPVSSLKQLPFNPAKDIIFVVGAIDADFEHDAEALNQTMLDEDPTKHYPLLLFRYPGGHPLSSGDATDPGVNLGAMIHANDNTGLDNVQVDGLYTYDAAEREKYMIPESYHNTERHNVSEPLVVTESGVTLSLKGGTVLKRGYNNTDASGTISGKVNFYLNSDYDGTVHNGGALYVAPDIPDIGETPARITTVNVEGLVKITGNKQKNGSDVINSNVYLPAFGKSLTLTDALDPESHIGITSPIRNTAKLYKDNTFSCVAVANKSGATLAQNATIAENARDRFIDDQEWFFTREYHNTYYLNSEGASLDPAKLYFGWTWANVVRTAPSTGYSVTGDDITVSTEEGLAWVTSQSAGLTVSPTDFSNKTIKQTADLDMKQYVWVPIGSAGHPFSGTYDGQGHLIDSIFVEYIGKEDLRYQRNDYGLFGKLSGGTVKRTFVVGGKIRPEGVPIEGRDGVYNIGGLVGQMDGSSVVAYSEAAEIIDCPNYSFAYEVNAGGLVGLMSNGQIHSSMSMSEIDMGAWTSGPVGGLVGKSEKGSIYNSFANAAFGFGHEDNLKKVGGLMGSNEGATVKNCYVTLHAPRTSVDVLPSSNNIDFDGIVNENTGGSINSVYLASGYNSTLIGANGCYSFSPVISADNLGYQYYDNFIEDDTTLVARLNLNAYDMNRHTSPASPSIDSTYAHWARPGIPEINGDLPVLLLGEFDQIDAYQGGFRSVGTYAGGPALQYGGPVRDDNELAGALSRTLEKNSLNENIPDYLFVYGDVSETATVAAGDITQSKVSIHEDASITNNSALANCANVYVGISFDNSCGKAMATPGVNYGLTGSGGDLLPRDWHMFSTPLANAPLGFNYQETNVPEEGYTNFNTEHYSNAGHYNNPWFGTSTEFGWLNAPGSNECAEGAGNRYWMGSQDGYFPKSRGSLFDDNLSSLFIVGSDECPTSGHHRYPYGMDFYTWTEPDYHWINFKRNGPNHWHTDGDDHEHIDYKASPSATANVNEETLIPGKGYLGAITKPTFMQSHGRLNAVPNSETPLTIPLTEEGKHLKGWNLVGNPFHGYIDFDLFSANANNTAVLQQNSSNQPFYVVYDADTYDEDRPGSGFLYQPKDGSNGGEYAGRYIHPHQGFYVKLKDNATSGGTVPTSLQFTEGMLVERADVKSDSHFRGWERDYPLVNLYLSSDNGCRDVTVIELDRPEWGGATKLKELRVGNGLFYGHHGDNDYAAMFVEMGTPKVPLWFEAKEDDIYTMTWNTANGNFHSMYLIDNITGIQYDMLKNNTYRFEGHKGDYWSRFYIVFDVTDVEENVDEPFVFFDGSEWVVTGEGDLEVIDVLGHVLQRTNVEGQARIALNNVAEGLYLMRLTSGKQCRIQKVVVTR